MKTRGKLKLKSECPEPLILQCNLCDSKFNCAVNFNKHKHYHNGTDDLLTCAECGKKLSCEFALERHLRAVHYLHLFESFQCNFCEKSFSLKQTLIKHVRNVHGSSGKKRTQACKFCKKQYAISGIYKHQESCRKSDTFAELKCPKCNMKFCRKEVLKKHIARKHSETSFKCETCFKRYRTEAYLESHISEQHPEGTITFACPVCKDIFSDEKVYFNHLERGKHFKESCSKCDQVFTDRELYFDHQFYCVKASRSTCKFCGRPMAKDNLQIHMWTYHKEKMLENTIEITPETFDSDQDMDESDQESFLCSPDMLEPGPSNNVLYTQDTVMSPDDCSLSEKETSVSKNSGNSCASHPIIQARCRGQVN